MEFGVFLPIANNGWIISKASPQYMPTFELNRHVTMKAEEVGFDFALSMVKYRGYGGDGTLGLRIRLTQFDGWTRVRHR